MTDQNHIKIEVDFLSFINKHLRSLTYVAIHHVEYNQR